MTSYHEYGYDFHIHSALSPCAQEEMTPNNIVNMARLNGLELIAVTDHNSAKNLPAIAECAQRSGILLIPGLEVESAEEVHVSCLFPDVDKALKMGELVAQHLPPLKNKEKIFGTQYIFDSRDHIVGKEEQLLLFSTALTVETIFQAARELGGEAYFSHVDRDSYSVLSVLGGFPDTIDAEVAEISDTARGRRFREENADLKEKRILFSSDSHRLADISRGNNKIKLHLKGREPAADDVINWIRKKT